MRRGWRHRWALALVLALSASATGCGIRQPPPDQAEPVSSPGGPAPLTAPAGLTPTPGLIGGAGAALPPLLTGDSGQTAIAVADRTGGWTGHLGDRRSRGPLDVTMACLDDGQIEVRATYGASLTVSCNGTLQGMHDETAPTGPVTVTVRPAALDQRWSIRVSRGRRGG